jgi:5-formyltetrahydrofolate cyclo-ligase
VNQADTDLAAEKRRARSIAETMRSRAHDTLYSLAPVALARLGLAFAALTPGSVVSGFHPHRSEPDTLPLLARLASEGFITALPVVTGKRERLIFRAWTPGDPIINGIWGIPMPGLDADVVEPDALLVPMLAFDARGFRLGYGGGYYDRTLHELRHQKKVVAIGVAYAAQEMASVPHGAHDAPLDYILTERGCRTCG